MLVTKRKPKPRGKPFTGKDDPRNNPNGRPTKARETAKSFAECFVATMHKEVEALENGQPIKATNYELFVKQMVNAGIKGTSTGTPARKLVLDFLNGLETKETTDEAKQATEGEDVQAFSWDAAKEQLYQDMKAAGRERLREGCPLAFACEARPFRTGPGA